MKVVVAVVGIGGWYPRGVARMIQRFEEVSPGIEIRAFVNVLPPGAPAEVIEAGYDYTGYCAKPFALKSLMDSSDVDIGILLDAAFYPVSHINPLISHICDNEFYFCKNGFKVGRWSSDRALETFGASRAEAFEMEELSSYCVGVDFNKDKPRKLVKRWADVAADRRTFPGPHTAIGHQGRNKGFVSIDPRVEGHRHDQTALSLIRWQMGLAESLLIERPRFTAYLWHESAETVLINHGGF